MVKVKICGLKDQATADAVCQLGADYIGFVFAKSKRQVSPELVETITANVPKTVKKVGVFVSPTLAELNETVRIAGLDLIQIHKEVPAGPYPVPLIVAQNGETTTGEIPQGADYLLLDAPPKEYVGGNGEAFDWLALDPKQLPQEQLIIAGGLDAGNVGLAIEHFQPLAVDVSSGVETDGEKDLTKIKEFITIVKGK